MIGDKGVFRTTLRLASLTHADRTYEVPNVVVDPSVMYSWLPASALLAAGIEAKRVDLFETRDGRIVRRRVGFAALSAGGRTTATLVVFGEHDDPVILGAHALSGLNFRVDPAANALVDAGPIPAAASAA